MLFEVLKLLRARGKDLAVTAALFELLTFVVLAPAVTLLFRLFIGISGRKVLADTDMLVFFLHPLWTVNDEVTMSSMIGRGVDGVITDDPAMAQPVLEFRAGLNPLERAVLNLAPLLRMPLE